MNIYLHVEIAAREFDSKLLLATMAAARGHDAMVADLKTLEFLRTRGCLEPGIFHTKSITPSESKNRRHAHLKEGGYVVTSIDEESGLLDDRYEAFARRRFSEDALAMADAVFCWGPMDHDVLKQMFPQHRAKFIETGSPRVDLWDRRFSEFWGEPAGAPRRPYVLVASNFVNANNYKRYWELLATNETLGYGGRDDAMEKDFFGRLIEETALVREFRRATIDVAERHPDIDFVVRPHPVEDPRAWQKLMPRTNNIHVIRDGAVSPWVNSAMAVVHNGCTTAIEATAAGTPVVTYLPIPQSYEYEFANRFGTRVHNSEELSAAIRSIVEPDGREGKVQCPDAEQRAMIRDRIRVDEDSLAAERLLDTWEQIGCDLRPRGNAWKRLASRVTLDESLRPPLRRLWHGIRGRRVSAVDDYKFPPLSVTECRRKVDRLGECLGLDASPTVLRVGARAIVVSALR